MKKVFNKLAKVIAIAVLGLMISIPQTGLADILFINAAILQGVAAPTTFYAVGGTYAATGSVLSVTGMPCQPDFLMLKSNGTGADEDAYIVWDGLVNTAPAQAGARVVAAAAPDTNNFTSFNSDGFTIKADAGVGAGFINKSGQTVYYLAICGDSTEIKTGKYVGNAVDNRDITGIGFDPDLVMIKRVNTIVNTVYAFSSQPLNEAFEFGAAAAGAANTLQDIITDGFQVGTSGMTNGNTATYNYFALKIPSGAGNCGSYTGNSTDNTDISITSAIQPEEVFIKGNAAVESVFRTDAHSGDDTTRYNNSTANTTNRIQQFNSDGFQVGTNGEVNTSATVYYYCALKDE